MHPMIVARDEPAAASALPDMNRVFGWVTAYDRRSRHHVALVKDLPKARFLSYGFFAYE